MKQIMRRAPQDDLVFIVKAARINASAFQTLKTTKDFELIRAYFQNIQPVMKNIDHQMTNLCIGDIHACVFWASRLSTALECLDRIERNLAFIGKRLFDWDSVIQSMGYLEAFRIGAQQTLVMNEEAASRHTPKAGKR